MTRNTKFLIVVVAFAAMAAAYWFLALAPQREEIVRLDGEIAAQEAQLAQSRQLMATYEQAKASYESNYATLARLGKAVPADDDVRSLLVQIDDAARRSGVDFGTIEVGGSAAGSVTGSTPTDAQERAPAPGTVSLASGFSAMPFSFTFSGGFFDLSTFLARLERFVRVQNEDIGVNGRLLRLESLQLQPGPDGFESIQAQIGAATYLVPSADDLPAGTTPQSPAGAATATPPSAESAVGSPTVPTASATGGTP